MHGVLSRLRLLPITLFAASLMLSVKIGNIWQGLEGAFDGSISIAGAHAQPPAAQDPPSETHPSNSAAQTDGQPETKQPPVPTFPHAVSQSEMDLLDKLAARRKSLEIWEREIQQRDALLKAAESRIDQKVEELKAMQVSLDSLIKVYDEQQDGQIQSLVKIYENMKPKDAARIFQELDMETLLLVAERMKERKLAAIMAKMDADRAKEVTVELARMRQMAPLDEQFKEPSG
jgi:flagellar motility protein MotE (MotC chaperone)